MAYCAVGDNPLLTYQFNGQPEKTVKFSFAPIDVTVKAVGSMDTGNYSPVGYGVSVISIPNYDRRGYTVTDYYVVDNGIPMGTFNYRYNFEIHGKKCGASDYVLLEYFVAGTIEIDTNATCPVAEESAMRIEVSYQNQVVYSDEYSASVTYSASCGDCPQGQCRCPSPGYPGYCCLDCDKVAGELRTITNELRRKNE